MRAIIAMTKSGGIGYKGVLPWNIPEELSIFRTITDGCKILVGNKTAKTLPRLKNRKVYCLSHNHRVKYMNDEKHVNSFNSVPSDCIVCGGAIIYDYFFKNNLIDKVYLSVIKKEYEYDTCFDLSNFENFVITEMKEYDEFYHYILERTYSEEKQYLDILKNILSTASMRDTRNSETLSVFNTNMCFNLEKGFPLLTTKKMFVRGILEELFFFLLGKTDSKELEDKNVNIWKGNTSREFLDNNNFSNRREGIMGEMYGYQWRFFNAKYNEETGLPQEGSVGVDQLKYVVDLINTDPTSRRILMTTYNPEQMFNGVLFPCHSLIIQFYVRDNKYLDMFAYNRSSDVFLGLPFNIASYAFLLHIVANMTSKVAGKLHITLGDTHIYKNHIDVCKEQMDRIPYKFPQLVIDKQITLDNLNELKVSDFIINNYNHHSSLKAEMIA